MGQKLLIIDDSLMLLRFAANVLTQHWPNLEIITAKRGAEGCARAQSQRPNLILLDYVLPDLSGDDVCAKLRQTPELSEVPIVIMSSGGSEVKDIEKRHPNVVKTISKPFTPELLVATLRTLFEDQQGTRVTPLVRIRESLELPQVVVNGRNGGSTATTRQVILRGDTSAFTLRSVLLAVRNGDLTGCLRVFLPKGRPTETYTHEGRVLLTTTKEAMIYRDRAEQLCRRINPAMLETALQGQTDSGCPFPILLALRDHLNAGEAADWVHRLGIETFAQLWIGRRLSFEFEKLAALPEWATRYSGPLVDVDEWIASTLRCIEVDDVPVPAQEDLAGIPAYTRDGYERIQRLNLTDLENAFASLVNGQRNLQSIAGRLRLSPESAYLLLFRFTMQEAMEYWPPAMIAELPPEPMDRRSHPGFATHIEPVSDLHPQSTGIFSEMLSSIATPSLTPSGQPKRYTVRIS